jgi:hypothetical protein
MRVASFILVAALAGCSTAQDAAESDQTVTQTIVHLMGDDHDPVVTTRVITVEEQQREAAARAARLAGAPGAGGVGEAQQAITQDPGCASSDVMAWDKTGSGSQSGTHEICFYGSGTANLSLYYHSCLPPPLHICSPWAGNVRSWSNGGQDVSGRWVDPQDNSRLFFGIDGEDPAGTVAAAANYLTIFN